MKVGNGIKSFPQGCWALLCCIINGTGVGVCRLQQCAVQLQFVAVDERCWRSDVGRCMRCRWSCNIFSGQRRWAISFVTKRRPGATDKSSSLLSVLQYHLLLLGVTYGYHVIGCITGSVFTQVMMIYGYMLLAMNRRSSVGQRTGIHTVDCPLVSISQVAYIQTPSMKSNTPFRYLQWIVCTPLFLIQSQYSYALFFPLIFFPYGSPSAPFVVQHPLWFGRPPFDLVLYLN